MTSSYLRPNCSRLASWPEKAGISLFKFRKRSTFLIPLNEWEKCRPTGDLWLQLHDSPCDLSVLEDLGVLGILLHPTENIKLYPILHPFLLYICTHIFDSGTSSGFVLSFESFLWAALGHWIHPGPSHTLDFYIIWKLNRCPFCFTRAWLIITLGLD